MVMLDASLLLMRRVALGRQRPRATRRIRGVPGREDFEGRHQQQLLERGGCLMIIAAGVELLSGVDAEQKSLEEVALPILVEYPYNSIR